MTSFSGMLREFLFFGDRPSKQALPCATLGTLQCDDVLFRKSRPRTLVKTWKISEKTLATGDHWMTDFEDRLKRAIQRGEQRRQTNEDSARQKQWTEDELKNQHSRLRLEISEHIEQCIEKMTGYLPGFQTETIYGERGWGAACSRDDFRAQDSGKRSNDYSRLEITVRPMTEYHVIDLAGKATIRNKEAFRRNFFRKIQDVETSEFRDLIDAWVVEFAELYST